jgi:hypothetical protein
MSVRDARSRPWLWLGLDALDIIRNVYMALAESATRAFDPDHASFKTTRAELAHLAGVSTKTVDRACAILAELGLLEMLPQSDIDGRTLPSLYRMGRGGDTKSPRGVVPEDTESPPITRTRDKGKNQETEPTAQIAREPAVKFRGRKAPPDVATASLAALDRWNERTGQTLKPFDGRGKTSSSLSVIVGTMLDYPEAVTLWPDMIDRALACPWWSDDAPGTGVVFGGKVRERMIQQAQRPAIAATSGGNVHAIRQTKFERAQSGLADLHARLVAEGK